MCEKCWRNVEELDRNYQGKNLKLLKIVKLTKIHKNYKKLYSFIYFLTVNVQILQNISISIVAKQYNTFFYVPMNPAIKISLPSCCKFKRKGGANVTTTVHMG